MWTNPFLIQGSGGKLYIILGAGLLQKLDLVLLLPSKPARSPRDPSRSVDL